MTAITDQERAYWGRHFTGEPWEQIGWFPPVAGWRRGGQADPQEAHEALARLRLPDSAAETLNPWADAARRDEAVANGTLVRHEGTGTAGAVYVTRAALEALEASGEPASAAVRAEARHALLRLAASPFAAYITGYDTCRVAAIAAFRFKDGTEVPSGLGGNVPGESLVIALWDEVRGPVIEAAEAREAEMADPSGAEWLRENY